MKRVHLVIFEEGLDRDQIGSALRAIGMIRGVFEIERASPIIGNAATEAQHGAEQPQLANGAIALMEKIDRFDIEQPNESWHHFMDSILTEWRKGKSESRAIQWMN